MFKIIITLLTFIPWIAYTIAATNRSIKTIRNQKLDEKLKKFHLDTIVLGLLFLIIALIFKNSDQIKLVKMLLFITFNIYLLLYCIYDKKNKYDIDKKDRKIIYIMLLIMIIPIIFYLATKFYTITYYIMFIYNILNTYLVLLFIKNKKKKRKWKISII